MARVDVREKKTAYQRYKKNLGEVFDRLWCDADGVDEVKDRYNNLTKVIATRQRDEELGFRSIYSDIRDMLNGIDRCDFTEFMDGVVGLSHTETNIIDIYIQLEDLCKDHWTVHEWVPKKALEFYLEDDPEFMERGLSNIIIHKLKEHDEDVPEDDEIKELVEPAARGKYLKIVDYPTIKSYDDVKDKHYREEDISKRGTQFILTSYMRYHDRRGTHSINKFNSTIESAIRKIAEEELAYDLSVGKADEEDIDSYADEVLSKIQDRFERVHGISIDDLQTDDDLEKLPEPDIITTLRHDHTPASVRIPTLMSVKVYSELDKDLLEEYTSEELEFRADVLWGDKLRHFPLTKYWGDVKNTVDNLHTSLLEEMSSLGYSMCEWWQLDRPRPPKHLEDVVYEDEE